MSDEKDFWDAVSGQRPGTMADRPDLGTRIARKIGFVVGIAFGAVLVVAACTVAVAIVVGAIWVVEKLLNLL